MIVLLLILKLVLGSLYQFFQNYLQRQGATILPQFMETPCSFLAGEMIINCLTTCMV
jgi:hypothetical protein